MKLTNENNVSSNVHLFLLRASNAVLHQLPTEACVFIRYAAAHRLTDPPYNLEPEPNDLSCGPWEQGRFRHFDDDDDEKFPNGYLNAVRSHSVLLFFCANRIRPSFHTCRLL